MHLAVTKDKDKNKPPSLRLDRPSKLQCILSFQNKKIWEIDIPPYPEEQWFISIHDTFEELTIFNNKSELISSLAGHSYILRRDTLKIDKNAEQIQMGCSYTEPFDGVNVVTNPFFDYELLFQHPNNPSNIFLSLPMLSYDSSESSIAIWHLAIARAKGLGDEMLFISVLDEGFALDTLERYSDEEDKAVKLKSYTHLLAKFFQLNLGGL
jgi:hypothetical protein